MRQQLNGAQGRVDSENFALGSPVSAHKELMVLAHAVLLAARQHKVRGTRGGGGQCVACVGCLQWAAHVFSAAACVPTTTMWGHVCGCEAVLARVGSRWCMW
jgi:hypothetical protein